MHKAVILNTYRKLESY